MKFPHLVAVLTLVAFVSTPAAEVDHSKMDHAAMGHGAPTVKSGPWAYTSRQNPASHQQDRWEMVPVPGYGHMFVSTRGLSEQLRCAALANPGVMVDRAARAACGVEMPASVSVSGDRVGH